MIDETKIEDVLAIVLDQNVFPDDTEFETLFGIYRSKLLALLPDLNFNRDNLRKEEKYFIQSFVATIKGYPHMKDAYILEKYGVDIAKLDISDFYS